MTQQRTRQRVVAPPAQGRFAAIEAIAADAQTRYGVPVITKATALPSFTYLETGVFLLDLALLGGVPEGQASMIFGWESSGKTTLVLRIIAAAQRKWPDKAAVFVDAEHTYDPLWAAVHGVDNDRLYLVQPESGEAVVDIIEATLRTAEASIVILDSIPAIVPQAEIDSSAEDALVAKRAQLIGRLCSKILFTYSEQRPRGNFIPFLWTNQWRMKIGVTHGDPKVLPGGNQPKFLSTTMIETMNKEVVGPDSRGVQIAIKNEHSFRIRKSKAGNSIRTGEYTMIRDPAHPRGAGAIDDAKTIVVFAKRAGLFTGGTGNKTIAGLTRSFRIDADVEDYLSDPENVGELELVKRNIIASQRLAMGLAEIPHDGWLNGIRS